MPNDDDLAIQFQAQIAEAQARQQAGLTGGGRGVLRPALGMPAGDNLDALAASAAPAPLLTIDTYVPERQPVKIDGMLYLMRSLLEFGVTQRYQIMRLWSQYLAGIKRMTAGEILSTDEAAVLDQAVDHILRAALPDVPAETYTRIGSQHKEVLLNLFFQLTHDVTNRTVTPITAAPSPPLTGAKRSRASSGSIARKTRASG